jgi:uncharacterized membrane protein
MKKYDYAVFILTHGRPNAQKTLRLLQRNHFTGRIYLLCDDEDETLDEYRKRYGDMVLVFSKKDYFDKVDTMDNGGSSKTILYARNACFDIAKQVGVDYFIQLDDDYTFLCYTQRERGQLKGYLFRDLDALFQATFDLLEKTGALTIAYAQNGDLIGGARGGVIRQLIRRKAMNWFFFKTDRRYEFRGRMNDDVNAYIHYALTGELVFTVTFVVFHHDPTQKQPGGITDLYLELGTYVKSFYPVMLCPSAVRIGRLGYIYPRIHHKVLWEYCAPKIISEQYRKV